MKQGIFVSYRRDETAGHAGRLYDRLVTRFGKDRVFIDVDSIRPGSDFVKAIESTLVDAAVVVVVIGPHWVRAQDVGVQGLDDAEDFVFMEVSRSLELGKIVIPVLVAGAGMPRVAELPDDVKLLVRLHAIEVSDTRFNADAERLSDTIDELIESPPTLGLSSTAASTHEVEPAQSPPMEAPELTARPLPPPRPVAVPPTHAKHAKPEITAPTTQFRAVVAALAVVAVLMIGGFVVWFLSSRGDERAQGSTSSSPSPTSNTASGSLGSVAETCRADACSSRTVSLPFDLSFGEQADVGGIADAHGQGTGFRFVQPSSYGDYHPELLAVGSGVLSINATKGTQLGTRDDAAVFGTREWFQNAQDNALGVEFDTTTAPTTIGVTVVDVPTIALGELQQAGLWLGPDEDNYLKLTLIQWPSTSGGALYVQILRELNASTTAEDQLQVPVTPVPAAGEDIELRLQLDPVRLMATGSFLTEGAGMWRDIGSLKLPEAFFSAAGEAGIFVTKRDMPEASPLVFRFDNFAVRT